MALEVGVAEEVPPAAEAQAADKNGKQSRANTQKKPSLHYGVGASLKPYKPTHPGEVLKDELEYRGRPRCRCRPSVGHAERIRYVDGRAQRVVYGEAEKDSPHCCGILRTI